MTIQRSRQVKLPSCADRLRLGNSGLRVSPICLGMTDSPETVLAAYEEGVNFFFLSADLHWPLYEPNREGLRRLLAGNKTRRDEIVVGIVSYLDEPLFNALQFNEVLDEVPGLDRVDLLIAGAVSSDHSFYPRAQSLANARSLGYLGARAIGASFHQRAYAVVAANAGLLDVSFTRYNALHPGARDDLYPYLHPQRTTLNYNFKNVMSHVPKERLYQFGFTDSHWLPEASDSYRFALTPTEVDGLLCSPANPAQFKELVEALAKGPLGTEEEKYMLWLSSLSQTIGLQRLS